MEEKCRMICIGRCKVGARWQTTARNGLNRLYYINGGTGGYIKGGERIPFKKGMLYFIPFYANVTTYTDLSDELDHTYAGLVLSPPVLSADVFCLDPDASPYINSAVRCFGTLCESKTPLDAEWAEWALLKSVSIYLINAAVQSNPQSVISDQTVLTALGIMHSSEGGRLTVAEIAAKCHMSTNGFIKKFTTCVGETPYAYYKSLRLRSALTLRAEGATLIEAALSCGYSDASALLHAIAASKDGVGV